MATETEAVTENRDSSEESETLGETIAMPVITEDTEEQSSENFVPDAEKDETDVKGENSFRKIKICLSKIKSFLDEEDDEHTEDNGLYCPYAAFFKGSGSQPVSCNIEGSGYQPQGDIDCATVQKYG